MFFDFINKFVNDDVIYENFNTDLLHQKCFLCYMNMVILNLFTGFIFLGIRINKNNFDRKICLKYLTIIYFGIIHEFCISSTEAILTTYSYLYLLSLK